MDALPRCFRVNAADNVATLLDDAPAGPVHVLGGDAPCLITALCQISLGHKIALHDIGSGQAIVKFGAGIGRASRDIAAGDWVHLHNCQSQFDQRSQTLDLHSGAATDRTYE